MRYSYKAIVKLTGTGFDWTQSAQYGQWVGFLYAYFTVYVRDPSDVL